jgi:hypothetical protein
MYISITNVTPVLTQMRGNPVSAGILRHQRGANRIGIVTTTRVAKGRDMIDIHTKP